MIRSMKEKRDIIVCTPLAEKIYELMRKINDDEEYILGIMFSFKTDEERLKLLNLINNNTYKDPGDLLIDAMVLADVVKIAH